jgi:hypothetical protein
MIAHIKKEKIFPNVKMKWCTESLKIKPMHKWLKKKRFTVKNTRQWIGIRRDEGGRLGGIAGGNEKDRAFTTSVGERHGFEAVFPEYLFFFDVSNHSIVLLLWQSSK